MNGDRLAQKEIYRLYYKAMYATSLRILNDQAEAEDAMQESFLAAFLKLKTYRGEMNFGAWLKRIVINKSIDQLRTRKLRFEEFSDNTDITEDVKNNDLFEPDESMLKVQKIKEAIKLLPEGFRVVLSLALFEGYDHEEIAMILNISESTSRSQLTRAKRKLVEYLRNIKYESFG